MTCDYCLNEIGPQPAGSISTGYGHVPAGAYGNEGGTADKLACFSCCGVLDARNMAESSRFMLYDVGQELTNWPGTFRVPVRRRRKGSHNVARTRHDIWLRYSGHDWHGVRYGEHTQIVHLKRLKWYPVPNNDPTPGGPRP